MERLCGPYGTTVRYDVPRRNSKTLGLPPLRLPPLRLPPLWLELGLVFLVFFVAGSDAAPHRNEAHYLTRLKHFWDPGWCAGDLFLESPDAHFTVVWLFGWVTRFASLEATAWIGRVLTWGLLAWGWTRLARLAAPRPWIAPLTAALFVTLTEQTHLAGEWVIGGFEAKCVAYAFLFFGLADWITGRWNRVWILLGIASAFHALVGGWSVVALLGVWAIAEGRRPPWRAMLPGLLTGGVISLLGVVPALALTHDAPPELTAQANQIYVFTRLPHHLAPFSQPSGWLVERILRFAIGLAIFFMLTRQLLGRNANKNSVDQPDALRRLAWFAYGLLAIAAAGLLIEVLLIDQPARAASLLRYYWFRMGDIGPAITSSLMMGAWLGKGLSEHRPRVQAMATACVIALAVWGVGQHVVTRFQEPAPPADQRMRDPGAWEEMCEWVRENTPEDSLFLLPRLSHTFKWRTGRPEVVTWKDVPQDPASLVEWHRRARDVYQIGHWPTGEPRWTRSLASLGATRLKELAATYGADFVLDQAPRRDAGRYDRYRASLPVMHRVGPYTLYDLRGKRRLLSDAE